MRFAKNALVIALTMLALLISMSAQATLRSSEDNRNQAPTVGTGGPVGGPTGLFTIYDGQTLRRGEFTFSAAYSNFARDPGDTNFQEVPLSFQIGLSDHLELFFTTEAYRAIKVNSPENLSGFYLPNVTNGAGVTRNAIILAPGTGGLFSGRAVFRPAGSQPFVQFPFVGGTTGGFGFPAAFSSGPSFGFAAGTNPTSSVSGSNGMTAASFPGIGSPYGSILPGVVLSTQNVSTNPLTGATTTIPVIYTLRPSYLPDAPFLSRGYGESSFNTFVVGAKYRITGPSNPIGIGLVPFYRFYADKANSAAGFNQLQRGASPGGNRGDFGLTAFVDARLRKYINVSGNASYIYNSSVKGQFPGGTFTLLDRPDEFNYGVGVDFPVNKYFQPILEYSATQYVGGRTPNAFENNPKDGIAGARIFPRRWFGVGLAYRYNFNEQSLRRIQNSTFSQNVTTDARATNAAGAITGFGAASTTTSSGNLSNAFRPSSNPNGFIVQFFAGHRNARGNPNIVNQPANVTALDLDRTQVVAPCGAGFRSTSGGCADNGTVNVRTTAVDPENDVLTYSYTVSGGRVVGTGANVGWDLTGVRPGTYTITAAVDDGCGFCGQPKTTSVNVVNCPDCVPIPPPCNCSTLSVVEPSTVTNPGDVMTFTANVSGGNSSNVTYNWTVSSGTIIDGQGTPTIRVQTAREMAGQTITATFTIGNAGNDASCNCPTTASGNGSVGTPRAAQKVDEFGPLQNDDVKARIDAFYRALSADPTATGTIINYGTDREVAARIKQINTAIKFLKYDPSRVTFVRGGNQPGIRTELYLVPAGVAQPTPGM